MPRILIVEDNEDLAFGLRASLEIEDAPSGGARFIAELPAAPAHA